MTFPDMITTTINLPKSLLEVIDTYAEQHLLNRSACIRLLVSKGMKDTNPNLDHSKSAGNEVQKYAAHQEHINTKDRQETKEPVA